MSNPIVERAFREGLQRSTPFAVEDLAALSEALKDQSYDLPELVAAIREYPRTVGHLAKTAVTRRDKALAG